MSKIWQNEFLKIFRDHYNQKKVKNPSYSIRSFARQIGVAPGPTSALLKGTRTWDFSREWVLSVVKKMNLEAEARNRLFILMEEYSLVEVLKPSAPLSEEEHHELQLTNLDFCKSALETLPLDKKEFQLLTFSGSSVALAEIKNELRYFLERVSILMDRPGQNDEVYRISLQLFPVNFERNLTAKDK